MKKKVITVELNERSINAAIKELESYKKWLKEKTEELVKELAKQGVEIAKLKFASAAYDGTKDVSVSFKQKKDTRYAVMAVGGTVLFIEFGTGITYPDDHPEKPAGLIGRGEYGHKLGRLPNGWRYNGDPGTNGVVIMQGKHAGMVQTKGNPANASLYLTERELETKFKEIVKKVFA